MSSIQDENILFYWTMLSADLDGELESVELLRDIAELWLTIILWIFDCQSLDGDLQDLLMQDYKEKQVTSRISV